jgi:hypothetical protein
MQEKTLQIGMNFFTFTLLLEKGTTSFLTLYIDLRGIRGWLEEC